VNSNATNLSQRWAGFSVTWGRLVRKWLALFCSDVSSSKTSEGIEPDMKALVFAVCIGE